MRKRLIEITLASIALAALPATAFACHCGRAFSPDQPPPPRLSLARRPVVFVGSVIDVEPPPARGQSHIVRFITERSWRGAMPDTVSLLVADAPCAYFTAGLRYVVAAAPDSVQAGRLRTGDCDEALRVGEMRGNALLDTLGAPNWRAPPLEEREIARRAVPLGTQLERMPFPGAVYFGPTLWDSVASVSIGDLRIFRSDPGTMRAPVAAYLEPGRLYRYRVTWSSGRVYESVLVGRCSDLSAAAEHCVLTVLFSLLAPAP